MHLPLQNRFSKINSAISAKIQDKKLRRQTTHHNEAHHQSGEYCLCCSHVRMKSVEKRTEIEQKTPQVRCFDKKRIYKQCALTIFPSQPATKSLSDIQKHNIRLMERTQQLQDQQKANYEQMLKKLYFCQQALETYNIEDISREITSMIHFLTKKSDFVEDGHKELKIRRQHEFYQKLVQTIKQLISQSDHAIFTKTKRALIDHNYFSVEQFQADLSDMSMAEMKKIQLMDSLKCELRNLATGNKMSCQGVLASWGLAPQLKLLQKYIKQKQSPKTKQLLMQAMDVLERAKLRLNHDGDFCDRIQQFLAVLRNEYGLLSTDTSKTSYNDIYSLLLIQSSAIEDFLVGNPDTDSQY